MRSSQAWLEEIFLSVVLRREGVSVSWRPLSWDVAGSDLPLRGSRAGALSWWLTAPCAVVTSVAVRCSPLKLVNSSQTCEPSAKVIVQCGWSVHPWLSLEFGANVHIEGSLVVRYGTNPWCWISLVG